MSKTDFCAVIARGQELRLLPSQAWLLWILFDNTCNYAIDLTYVVACISAHEGFIDEQYKNGYAVPRRHEILLQ